ncbi:CDP-alcohol phosphatidyltransferase family protein [Sphingomonas arenae]|uniref:CDP-alcohol phosphatidyltransferase family protein n=1 Tax=Sphingomonas arenae TaxID=2812555 RepID=UPI001967D393|nr:CDP-alcohol phosphatidyltransferase family protein [Sphingomonas arenae]
MPLLVTGHCDRLIFGLSPAERLRRQVAGMPGLRLVADASAVISEGTLQWLEQNPGIALVSTSGKRLAVAAVDGTPTRDLLDSAAKTVTADTFHYFNRKLRRREALFGVSLDEVDGDALHRTLFNSVYKGVTDLVTKFVWPAPAYWVTRLLAAARVTPNIVTAVGFLCMLLAAVLFARGQIALALVPAWVMTFLDTVDGKLARVTIRSSPIGNTLDHGMDIIHPPIWWLCLAYGVVLREGNTTMVQPAVVAMLGSYVAGRVVETVFKSQLGFNQFIWEPMDAWFRLIVARRNIILLIITVGLISGLLLESFLLAAAWSVSSALIQLVRLAQAWSRRPVRSFLSGDDDLTLAVSRAPKSPSQS